MSVVRKGLPPTEILPASNLTTYSLEHNDFDYKRTNMTVKVKMFCYKTNTGRLQDHKMAL